MRRLATPLLHAITAAVVFGLGKYHAAFIGDYDLTSSSRFAWSVVFVAVLGVAAYAVGLPERPRDVYEAMWQALKATVVAALTVSAAQLVAGSQLLPRFVVFWTAVFLVPMWPLASFLAVRGSRRQRSRDRVLAVLADEDASVFADDVVVAPERRCVLAAVVGVGEAAASPDRLIPLVDAAMACDANLLVLDRAAQADPSVVAQAAVLHGGGVRVRTLSLFYEQWLGKLPLSELERISLLFDIRELHQSTYARVKRLLDVVLAAVGVVALVVVAPLVVVGNVVANRGPLLYRQTRVGKLGNRFVIVKFRTMRPTAAGLADEWTSEDDPRITPFGRILRRSHLDELPQVLNILVGDLSVVGPRPEQPHYVDELETKIPFYGVRHLVRPGLTGWAQVKYGYAGDESDALEKLQYEFFYLRHQRLSFDLRIIGRTIRTVAGHTGR